MFSQKVLRRILMTTLKWAAVWALAGAAMGVVATLIEPDTGHIPRHLVPPHDLELSSLDNFS